MAKVFGIERWPVSAVEAYVGHSMASAGGDQLVAAMGTWEFGWMPGITTVDHIAEDVHDSNLLLLQTRQLAIKQTLYFVIYSFFELPSFPFSFCNSIRLRIIQLSPSIAPPMPTNANGTDFIAGAVVSGSGFVPRLVL